MFLKYSLLAAVEPPLCERPDLFLLTAVFSLNAVIVKPDDQPFTLGPGGVNARESGDKSSTVKILYASDIIDFTDYPPFRQCTVEDDEIHKPASTGGHR